MTSNRIKVSILIAVICLVSFSALSYVAYQRLDRLTNYTRTVNQINRFVLKLEEFITLHTDAETGIRGFLLTSDSTFLQPYTKAKKNIPRLLLQLTQSFDTTDIPVYSSYSILKRLSYEKFDSIFIPLLRKDQFIKQTDSLQFNNIYLKKSKIKMDSIRRIAGILITSQESLLYDQTKFQAKISQQFPVFFIYIVSLALLTLLGSIAVIFSQVVEMTNYQRDLEQKILEINQINEQLDQYSFTLTHHLQEPLRKIRLFSSLFGYKNKAALESNKEGYTLLEKIKELAAGVQSQLDEFLHFVKLNHRIESELHSVNINSIIQEILSDKKDTIEQSKAVIRIDEMPVLENANQEQIKILFERLLDNALKFQPSGAIPQIALTVSKTSPPNEPNYKENKGEQNMFYEFTLSDNGIGFDEKFTDKIFNLFERLHADAGFQGTGLGLTLVKRIVQLHHGYISVRSKINEGTVFRIYLPV